MEWNYSIVCKTSKHLDTFYNFNKNCDRRPNNHIFKLTDKHNSANIKATSK